MDSNSLRPSVALRRLVNGYQVTQALHVAAVLLDVACHEGVDGGSVVGIEVAPADEVVGQGAGLVEGPGLEGGHELGRPRNADQPAANARLNASASASSMT